MEAPAALVGEGGVEPPRSCDHRNLNPARLPIPPLARGRRSYPWSNTFGSRMISLAPNVRTVNVARGLERRLERLIEGVAGRLFSGRLHPSELASRLAREADFARFNHTAGPATANRFAIQINPRDLTVETNDLEEQLAAEISDYIAEEGLRVEGPIAVTITPDPTVVSGHLNFHVEVAPGPVPQWARLSGVEGEYPISHNRAIVGRDRDCDVVIDHDDISRQHLLVYREAGSVWIVDLDSANGTLIDGRHVTSAPAEVKAGSVITLSEHDFRLLN